jgi:hypothetical protein
VTQWPYSWRNGSDKFLQQLRRDLLRDDDPLWRILANRKYRPCTPVLVLRSRLSPAIGRSLQHVCRYESPKVVKCCRVDSAICPDVEDSSLRIRDHPARTPRRDNTHSIGEMRRAIYQFIWRIRSRMSTL